MFTYSLSLIAIITHTFYHEHTHQHTLHTYKQKHIILVTTYNNVLYVAIIIRSINHIYIYYIVAADAAADAVLIFILLTFIIIIFTIVNI